MKMLFFLALTAVVAHAADETAAKVAQTIDVKALPARISDDVVVPMPSEIFAVLDKLGKPHWDDVLRKVKSPVAPMPDREQTALLLGTVIAEGFIAVEATNAEEVKRIGRSVQNLSKAIGVEKAAYPRSKAIIDAADKHAPQSRRLPRRTWRHGQAGYAVDVLEDGADDGGVKHIPPARSGIVALPAKRDAGGKSLVAARRPGIRVFNRQRLVRRIDLRWLRRFARLALEAWPRLSRRSMTVVKTWDRQGRGVGATELPRFQARTTTRHLVQAPHRG